MKRIILLLVSSLGLGTAAQAAAPLAGDTLRGQHRFIQHVSATMCERLQAEEQKRPLASLSAVDAHSILAATIESSILAHADEMSTLMAANKVSNAHKAGEALGVTMILRLVESCPAGQQLMVGVIQSQFGVKLPITEAERPVLQLVTQDVCQRLDAENATRAMSSRSQEERRTVIMTALQGGMLKNMEPLANLYGLDNMKNNKLMESVGQKIALLIVQQCPTYMLQLGIDEYMKRK